MSSSIHTGMDIPKGHAPANNIEVRERTPTTAINLSRESSMASSSWVTLYHDKMDDRIDCDSVLRDKSPKLFYKIEQEKAFCFSKAFETTGNTRPQDRSNEASHHNPEHVLNENQNNQFPYVEALQGDKNNIINIQLPYDLNSPTKLDL